MSVKCAVVGLGIGAMHAKNLARIPDATLVAVADMDADRRRQATLAYNARAYPTWQEMLKEEQLDAVILATPAMVRLEPITAICERKIALFCRSSGKLPAWKIQTKLSTFPEMG